MTVDTTIIVEEAIKVYVEDLGCGKSRGQSVNHLGRIGQVWHMIFVAFLLYLF